MVISVVVILFVIGDLVVIIRDLVMFGSEVLELQVVVILNLFNRIPIAEYVLFLFLSLVLFELL